MPKETKQPTGIISELKILMPDNNDRAEKRMNLGTLLEQEKRQAPKYKEKPLTRGQKQVKITQEVTSRMVDAHSPYQELFEHMINEHGVILLKSEMDEIALICKRLIETEIYG